MFKTPILYIIFNRLDRTKMSFERLKEIRPQILFIAADGPRVENKIDDENCRAVRNYVIENIDWPCDVRKLFQDSNLGCKKGVSTAINWFFDNVEEGIIIEDDIIPDVSFFRFCSEILEYFRDDLNVMHIAGFNTVGRWLDNSQSYHGCRFGSIWGWASWRRAWILYDVNIKEWARVDVKEKILKQFPRKNRKDRMQLYDKLYEGQIDTWDYQWTFCRLLNNGISIVPSLNLIQNIGFDANATHTVTKPSWLDEKSYSLKFPLKHPLRVNVDKNYDLKHLEIGVIKKKYVKKYFKRVISLLKKKFLNENRFHNDNRY